MSTTAPSDTVHLLTNPNNGNTPFTVNDQPRIGGGLIVFSSTDFSNFSGPPTRHIYVTDLAGHIQTDITPGYGRHNPSRLDPSAPQTDFQQADISGNGRYLTFWAVANTFDPNRLRNAGRRRHALHLRPRHRYTSDHRDLVRQRRR